MFLSKHQRPRSPSPSHSHRVRWPFHRVRVWRWLVRPSTIAIIARHCPRDRPTMILLMQPDITFCSLLSAICILRASAKKNSTSNFRSEEFASALFGKLSQWHNDNLHNNTKQLQKCHTVVVAFKLVQYSDEGTGRTSATKSVYLFKDKIRYFYQTRVQIFALPLKLKCSVYVKYFSGCVFKGNVSIGGPPEVVQESRGPRGPKNLRYVTAFLVGRNSNCTNSTLCTGESPNMMK